MVSSDELNVSNFSMPRWEAGNAEVRSWQVEATLSHVSNCAFLGLYLVTDIRISTSLAQLSPYEHTLRKSYKRGCPSFLSDSTKFKGKNLKSFSKYFHDIFDMESRFITNQG